MSLVDDIGHLLAPPHPAGRPFVLGGLIAVMIGLMLGAWLSWIGLIFHPCLPVFLPRPRACAAWPAGALSPRRRSRGFGYASRPPPSLVSAPIPRWRVSIFLSLINVHVNRVPADGIITRIAYRHGSFMNASLDKASEANERNAIALRLADGREIAFVQIAGLIARRIVCDLREGDTVARRPALRNHPLWQPGGPLSA